MGMKERCDDGTYSYRVGFVRYIGKLQYHDHGHDFIGVELNEPIGRNNGTLQDVVYFKCAPPYGIFLHPDQVKPLYTSTVKEYVPLGKFGFLTQEDGRDTFFHRTDVAYNLDTIQIGQLVEHTLKRRWDNSKRAYNEIAENMRLIHT